METLVTILNPGRKIKPKRRKRVKHPGQSAVKARPKTKTKTGGSKVAKKRKNAKRVSAGKKAARTRKRRAAMKRNPSRRKRRTVRRKTRRAVARRSNPKRSYRRRRAVKRYRRRRNPTKGIRRIMGRWRLGRAVPILLGFSGGITLKPVAQNFIVPMLPITMQTPVARWFGVLTVMAGAWLANRGRRRVTKDAGLGMIVAGVYDVVASNFANLPFIPQILPGTVPGIAQEAETASGLGTSIGTGDFSVVGASNISADMEPDIVGCEDLDDLI